MVAPSNDPKQYCGFCCQKDVPGKLLQCSKCSNSGHKKCLQFADALWKHCKADKTWECIECKTCSNCRVPGQDEKLLFCDMCDCAMHMHCLTPPLSKIPQGNWKCPTCEPVGKASPKPQARLPKFNGTDTARHSEGDRMDDAEE